MTPINNTNGTATCQGHACFESTCGRIFHRKLDLENHLSAAFFGQCPDHSELWQDMFDTEDTRVPKRHHCHLTSLRLARRLLCAGNNSFEPFVYQPHMRKYLPQVSPPSSSSQFTVVRSSSGKPPLISDGSRLLNSGARRGRSLAGNLKFEAGGASKKPRKGATQPSGLRKQPTPS
jgi:hypothetical protein